MNCPIGTDVERAARTLAGGGLVAFATETVYGLAQTPSTLVLSHASSPSRADPNLIL